MILIYWNVLVIITDGNLNELERGHWIISYEKAELERLSEFHQKIFRSKMMVKDAMIQTS
jgi:oligoribonuclease (3'-5' exoribonuclease)